MAKKAAPSASTLPDESTLAELARQGLAGVASDDQIGPVAPIESTDGVVTVSFASLLPGYPGWLWQVNLSDGDGGEWGVLEAHLVPGGEALVAPDWVPWADRMEEYRRSEAERLQTEADQADDDDDVDEDDLDDDDLDGVDIDQLDLGLADDADPAALEIPDEPNDVFDHVDVDDELGAGS